MTQDYKGLEPQWAVFTLLRGQIRIQARIHVGLTLGFASLFGLVVCFSQEN